jgi:eukaryotic-like serine/threonine-protein kinase
MNDDPSLSRAPVRPGDILAGKYRVDGVLGIGGMGVVVAATHLQLGQRVAIKFLLPEAFRLSAALERFSREARAAALLKSDNVARVIDVATLESGAPYMVMELLEGYDLGAVIQQRGPLPLAEVIDFVVQACDAISEAHSLGIIHRDLKPKNLFLTRRRNGAPLVKVLDFGISKVGGTAGGDHSLTKTSDVMGSPNYMAPEQIRSSRNVDERTDIWALGVIVYELLTGRVPFEAETVPQLCSMVLEQSPPPLSTIRPDVPLQTVRIVERCLAKDPAARFASVNELVAALTPGAVMSAPRPVATTSDATPVSPLALSSGAVMASGGTSVTLGRTNGPRSMKAIVALIATLVVLVGVAAAFGWHRVVGPTVAQSPAASSGPAAASPPSVATPPTAPAAEAKLTTVQDSGAPSASTPHTAAAHGAAMGGSPVTATTTKPPPKPMAAPGDQFLPDERK